MKWDKKQIRVIIAAAAPVVVFTLIAGVYRPLWINIRSTQKTLKALDQELTAARGIIASGVSLEKKGRLLKRAEISLGLEEISRLAREMNIDFSVLKPQAIEQSEDASYHYLPIHMQLESQDQDLGRFLGALEELRDGLASVKSFRINEAKEPPGRLAATVVIVLYLRAD